MNKSTDPILDIIIIGGGPTGISCGIAASKAGLEYVILEKGVLVNSIYNFPANMTFFSTSTKLEIGGVPFISHNDKPTRQEALEYYRRLADAYQLNIHYQEPVSNVTKEENFRVTTAKSSYTTRSIVIATGFYDKPRMLNIPGEGLAKVKHYYDEAHLYIKQNIVVVGGANSACDVALETWQKGANVTMVVREDELYHKVKYWILPNIKNRISEGSIKAYFNSNLMAVRPDTVDISTPEGIITIPNDYVLAMTGYQPDYQWLQTVGIQINNDDKSTPQYDENSFESNIKGIYLAGVVQGGLHTSKLFIENTRDHGQTIIRHILSQRQHPK